MLELSTLSMTEIIRLQNQLQQELTRRFEQRLVLMFTDIVGSTAYFAQWGDSAGRQLQQLHLDLLGPCVQASKGRIVDTAGDGAFCAFASADAAVAGLIAFEKAVAQANAERGRKHQLLTRIGLHFGPVLTDGQTVSGDAVNLCARLAASAEPGEVRLTRQLFQELRLPSRLHCRPLGTLELRGLDGPVEALALDWRDRQCFPRRLRIVETGEMLSLPLQDIVSFGRLAEHQAQRANDVVLSHPNPAFTRQISRWHFELRRLADGLQLRTLSDNPTTVDGKPVQRGAEVLVRGGTLVGLSGVLTLQLVADNESDSSLAAQEVTTMMVVSSHAGGAGTAPQSPAS